MKIISLPVDICAHFATQGNSVRRGGRAGGKAGGGLKWALLAVWAHQSLQKALCWLWGCACARRFVEQRGPRVLLPGPHAAGAPGGAGGGAQGAGAD